MGHFGLGVLPHTACRGRSDSAPSCPVALLSDQRDRHRTKHNVRTVFLPKKSSVWASPLSLGAPAHSPTAPLRTTTAGAGKRCVPNQAQPRHLPLYFSFYLFFFFALTERRHGAGLQQQAVPAAARLQQGARPRLLLPEQPQPFAQRHGDSAHGGELPLPGSPFLPLPTRGPSETFRESTLSLRLPAAPPPPPRGQVGAAGAGRTSRAERSGRACPAMALRRSPPARRLRNAPWQQGLGGRKAPLSPLVWLTIKNSAPSCKNTPFFSLVSQDFCHESTPRPPRMKCLQGSGLAEFSHKEQTEEVRHTHMQGRADGRRSDVLSIRKSNPVYTWMKQAWWVRARSLPQVWGSPRM